jgi:hypothetical protein
MCLSMREEIAKGPSVMVTRYDRRSCRSLGGPMSIANRWASSRPLHACITKIVQAVIPHCLPLSPRSIIDVSPTWYGNHSPSPTYSMSNHALIRLACIAGIPRRDVRRTTHADGDHAHTMEPSVASGVKIAYVISTLAREHHFNHGRPNVYV